MEVEVEVEMETEMEWGRAKEDKESGDLSDKTVY